MSLDNRAPGEGERSVLFSVFDGFAAFVLLIGFFIFQFRGVLTNTITCSMFQDNTYLIHPILHHLATVISEGERPLWMNTIAGGISLYNNPQLSALYPLYMLGLGWYQDVLQIGSEVHILYLIHSVILIVNSYIMMRALGGRKVPAAFGAALLTASADMASYRFWANMFVPYAWLPLVVAGAIMILDRREKVGFFALVLGASMLTLGSPSHPLIETVYIVAVLTGWRVATFLLTGELKRAGRAILIFGAAGVATFLICSPLLISLLEFMNHAVRFVGAGFAVTGSEAIPREAMTEGQYSLTNLLNVFFPLGVPNVVGDGYFGAAWVVLAILGLFAWRTSWAILPLALFGVYALFSATGSHTPLFEINIRLPLLNKIREPTHYLVFTTIAASVLAMFGLQAAIRKDSRFFIWIIGLLGGTAISIAGLYLTSKLGLAERGFPDWALAYKLVGAAALSILIVRLVPTKLSGVLAIAPAIFTVWSATLYPFGCPEVKFSDYYHENDIESRKVLSEVATLPDINAYRLMLNLQPGKFSTQFWAMNASEYKIRTLSAYLNPLPVRQFYEVWDAHGQPNYGRLLGGKYLLCDDCAVAKKAGYRELKSVGSYTLMVTDSAQPLFAMITAIAGRYEGKEEFFNLIASGYPPPFTAYFPSKRQTKLPKFTGENSVKAEVAVISVQNNERVVSTNSASDSILVMNEFRTGEWHATVDGNEAEIFPVNLNQIGVALPPGSHSVTFSYRPSLYLALCKVQTATVLLLIIIGVYFIYRNITEPRRRLTVSEAA